MSKISKLLFSIFTIALVVLSGNAGAITELRDEDLGGISCLDAKSQYGKQYNYIITDYDITINVRSNNVYDIVEKYDVCFAKKESHGIYRNIPKTFKGWREDGSKFKAYALVKNVSVEGDKAEYENDVGTYNIKIGDPDRYVSGNKQYTIRYTYDYGEDKLDGADEFYFNLIGSEWDADTIILNTDFEIYMPSKFTYTDETLGFSSGTVNHSRVANVDYTVDGQIIKGSSNEIYPGGHALTFRVVLPQGYYSNMRKDSYIFTNIAIFASALMLLINYIFFAIFGKDNKLVQNIQYDPPKDLNPLEFGLLNNKTSRSSAVMSLVFHLAEKGYLKISDTSSKHFTIHKVKEYDGNDPSEKVLMNKLFKFSTDGGQTVTDKELKNKFYAEEQSVINASKYNKLYKDSYKQGTVTLSVILIIISCLVLMGVILFWIGQATIIASAISVWSGLLAMILAFIAIIVGACVRKRTDFGDKLFSQVKSYAETIKSTNILSGQGASYFYYNYAYAYAVGYATEFSNKFKEVVKEAPSWYEGSNFTNIHSFSKSLTTAANNATYSPGSSSGGGGGSAGGGGGGGGGGGW